MSNQCKICGQFSSQASQKTVKLRGMDRRNESRRVEFDVSDVFTGECCGSDVLEDPEPHRFEGTYQRYLNETPDGSVRFVLLIEIGTETVETRPRNSAGKFVSSNSAESELEYRRYVPVADFDLPDRVYSWMIGKFGEIETGAKV